MENCEQDTRVGFVNLSVTQAKAFTALLHRQRLLSLGVRKGAVSIVMDQHSLLRLTIVDI